jgi:F-type H+-transporting ATPase subunit a
VVPVLADLLPNVNELFEYDGIFGRHQWYEFNKTALMAFISTLICIGLFFVGSRKRAMVPAGLQNAAEMGYETVEQQIAVEVMGPQDGKHWAPFLSTLFFWIFFINIWSTVPFVYFPATSRMAIPLYLALQTWVIFIFVGFKHQGLGYFRNVVPSGVPGPLLILVVPIEIISKYFIRPFSLAVRLFANMMAGHILLTALSLLTAYALSHNPGVLKVIAVGPFLLNIGVIGFEILVAFLQAYIFTLLTAVYLGDALHPEH